ncbi:GD15851 [Drosophila simulans]|uniref:GD15851 n=1 Tax=Drosophila simulans TaxID=7240 RepID=B4R4U0_DROSI|nr:GD15851 [Drosophila simulans]
MPKIWREGKTVWGTRCERNLSVMRHKSRRPVRQEMQKQNQEQLLKLMMWSRFELVLLHILQDSPDFAHC